MMAYFAKVFVIATAFQEFAFIVKYTCIVLFTSTFAARSLSLIDNRQKNISPVFRMCSIQFQYDIINAQKWRTLLALKMESTIFDVRQACLAYQGRLSCNKSFG